MKKTGIIFCLLLSLTCISHGSNNTSQTSSTGSCSTTSTNPCEETCEEYCNTQDKVSLGLGKCIQNACQCMCVAAPNGPIRKATGVF